MRIPTRRTTRPTGAGSSAARWPAARWAAAGRTARPVLPHQQPRLVPPPLS